MKPCNPKSPYFPKHRFTSRFRVKREGAWSLWSMHCCWCGQEKP